MTSMQYVKKMVLIPYDEYNSWKESKKVGTNPTQMSETHLPESNHNITKPHHSHDLLQQADDREQDGKQLALDALPDNTYKELVSKIGSTVLDLLVRKGAKSLHNFIGAGEYLVAPPPGEPDAKKQKRELTEENQSSATGQQKLSNKSPVVSLVEDQKAPDTGIPKLSLKSKVTWKPLR